MGERAFSPGSRHRGAEYAPAGTCGGRDGSPCGRVGHSGDARRSRRYADPVKRRLIRLAGTLVVTGLCAAYIFWKIDISRTVHVLVHANFGYFAAAVAIVVLSVWPMAWRWQRLLAAKGIHDRLGWAGRGDFLAYTGGEGPPSAVWGVDCPIFDDSRRHPRHGGARPR